MGFMRGIDHEADNIPTFAQNRYNFQEVTKIIQRIGSKTRANRTYVQDINENNQFVDKFNNTVSMPTIDVDSLSVNTKYLKCLNEVMRYLQMNHAYFHDESNYLFAYAPDIFK